MDQMTPKANQIVAGTVAALTDDDVVERIRGGEATLFEILMRRYNQRIFRVARAVLRSEDEAEDVVQETFVRAFERLHQYEARGSFGGWLTRIALRESLARRRKMTRSHGGGEPPREETEDPASTREHTPEDNAAWREVRSVLIKAIDALPDTLRVVFVLREVEGLGTAEVAGSLGLSEQNVKVRLHRARAHLRGTIDAALGTETARIFEFGGARCDRTVARVFERLGLAPKPR